VTDNVKAGPLITAIACPIAALLCLATTGPVRFAAGAILALGLSGYGWTGALFPAGALRGIDRVALTAGIGLVVAVITGIGLSVLGFKLEAQWFAVAFALSGVAGSVLEALRSQGTSLRIPRPSPLEALRSQGSSLRIPRPSPLELLVLGVAAIALAAAGQLATVAVAAQPRPAFTQFWIVGVPEDPETVRVGVLSMEHTSTKFRIEINVDGRIGVWVSEVSLAPDEQRITDVKIPVNGRTIEANLYADGIGKPYRHVVLYRATASAPSEQWRGRG
jgi:uncharacterized membrane protein